MCQMEAAPAAGSEWPRTLFTALSPKARPLPALVSTAVAAPNSMGSPRGVPVPCISRLSTTSAVRLAFLNANLMTWTQGSSPNPVRPSRGFQEDLTLSYTGRCKLWHNHSENRDGSDKPLIQQKTHVAQLQNWILQLRYQAQISTNGHPR